VKEQTKREVQKIITVIILMSIMSKTEKVTSNATIIYFRLKYLFGPNYRQVFLNKS